MDTIVGLVVLPARSILKDQIGWPWIFIVEGVSEDLVMYSLSA